MGQGHPESWSVAGMNSSKSAAGDNQNQKRRNLRWQKWLR